MIRQFIEAIKEGEAMGLLQVVQWLYELDVTHVVIDWFVETFLFMFQTF